MSYVTVIRLSARVLTGLIVLFFGFFLVAHLIGNEGGPSRPLNSNDYLILVTLVLSLVGLLLALKREFTGAVITLIAILVCAAVNWKILVSPGALIPLTALLYLFSWSRSPRVSNTLRA